MDKSSWSIIQWLPNEVLSEVLRFCAPRELAILLRVAKLFNEIGLPLLYRDLYLDISQAKLASALSFRVSIERDPARALMIKAIRIIALDLANIEAVASIMEGIKNFTTIVPAIVQLTNIEVFRIVCEFDEEGLLDLLDVAFFPKMHTLTLAFSGLLHPSQISPFINRHPTLRSVSLQSNSVFGDNFSVFLSAFPRIELLEHMSAPFEYFLGDIPSKNLTSASIDFSVYGRPEIGRTFVSLANSAAKDSCKTLVCITQGLALFLVLHPLMNWPSSNISKSLLTSQLTRTTMDCRKQLIASTTNCFMECLRH
ncbi:uncharacterized protein BT62DRAFT_445946 [Guyanagaster necrorhizus]|uniref:F-box domain-containing protein n=1 Tax=Guyanagaster necrorhizus TaxID=856835 RepID=A0A9P8AQ04_9AGAR|nr:uncharacterized protein BT62DRAFT_445946 [Guyanagaster necrorhizus MCA 3950]KAG7442372.1 hypothetical protein BT62DRAFT_445946 [Guyanagaster necrorhizus MCA 3950]